MSCKKVTDFLSDYLAGALPLRQRLAFKLHLLLCRDCRNYLDSFATTVRVAQSLNESPTTDDTTIPPELVLAIMAAVGHGKISE